MKFRKCKLSELGEIVGGATPSTKNKFNYGGNISWITPKDLTDLKGRFINRGERNITKEGFENLSTKMLPINSVLFSSRAPIGYIAINNMNEVCTNQGFKSIIPNDKINYMFLYYLLKFNKDRIESLGSGTTFKEISGAVMKNIVVSIPENKNDQLKIAKVLSKIDEKIELNTHINNNLQDFLLSQYKLYFDNKETNGKLKDIVKKMNRTIKRDKINKLLKYYPIDILPKNNIILQEGKDIEEAQSSLIEFNSNEILVGAMRIYFHRVCISNNAGITRNTTFVLTPKQEEYLYYALLTIYQDSFIEYASLTSKGTTMPYAVWENVCSEFNIYIPTKEELKEFNVICKAIINKMNINQEQNNKLEKIRDTLLPKLMNGEIDLDKIEI